MAIGLLGLTIMRTAFKDASATIEVANSQGSTMGERQSFSWTDLDGSPSQAGFGMQVQNLTFQIPAPGEPGSQLSNNVGRVIVRLAATPPSVGTEIFNLPVDEVQFSTGGQYIIEQLRINMVPN